MPLTPDERRTKAIILALNGVSEAVDSLRNDLQNRNPVEEETVRTLKSVNDRIDTFAAESRAQGNQSNTFQNRSIRVQWCLFWATFAAFAAAAIYAGIANQQRQTMDNTFSEVEKQTRLMQREVEGATAALVTIQFRALWQERSYLSVIMLNRGRSTAFNIHADLKAVVISLPSEKSLNRIPPLEWKVNITDFDPLPDSIERGIYLDLASSDLRAGRSMGEAIKLTGTFTYYNGFRPTSQPICYYMLSPVDFRNKLGFVVQSYGAASIACDDFPVQSATYRRLIKDTASK
jgi:hypothetical protein